MGYEFEMEGRAALYESHKGHPFRRVTDSRHEYHSGEHRSPARNRSETILWLDALRPHLARAGLLSARLAFERARRCHGGAP
jgi:hypothetical protein